MSTTATTANTNFIDLATFSELEGFLYGGPHAITWFVSSVTKSNWFSFIPISLRHTQTPDFGQRNVQAKLNRSADYCLGVWFRCYVPQIGLKNSIAQTNPQGIRWVKNFMHNLFERIQVSFNELVVQEFSNYWLDARAAFTIDASKRVGYDNMIGNGILDNDGQSSNGVAYARSGAGFFQLPLPVFWAEDSGISLPLAALPFNEITINYNFRRWQELVVLGDNLGGNNQVQTISDVAEFDPTIVEPANPSKDVEPSLKFAETFAHYVTVHNDERAKMGDAPRDMLIHQIQESSVQPFKDVTTRSRFDIRHSHAVVANFFMVENRSWFDTGKGAYGRIMSNYTTAPSELKPGFDPIQNSILLYEATVRYNMGADYFSLTAPYYFCPAIPEETGYHMHSYALNPWACDGASGSTNYSKLANVTIEHEMSVACTQAASGLLPNGATPAVADWGSRPAAYAAPFRQTFHHVFISKNHNIVRVANGSLGQPAL